MKKLLLAITIPFLLASGNAHAQWTQLVIDSFNEMRSAFFINSQTGYIAGSGGIILKTTDGGANWIPLNSSTTDTLRSLYFTDDTTGYAVGAQGTIMKTTDAGISWQSQVSGITTLLRSVYFSAHDTGYIAGGNGTILKTTDAGNTWIQQTSGTTQDLISLRFVSPDTGYAVSSLSTFLNGIILKTSDGGTNWITVHTNANGFLGVFPVNNDTVFAVGNIGTIVKSTDGGATWLTQVSGITTILRAVFFLNADTGYTCGDAGNSLFTGDGGVTWVNQSIQAQGLLGLHFPMHDTGYAVGNAGTVLRYSKPCALATTPVQIFGGTTICEGDTITYYINSVPNATGYTWSAPPGASVTTGQGDTLVTIVFSNVSGNVSVTADNLCGQSIPRLLLVSVNGAPSVPVISNNGLGLVSTNASTYQWYLNGNMINGADSSFYYPLQNGSYTVVITNAFGCSSTSAPFSVINAGITDVYPGSFHAGPLPFNEFLEFVWKNGQMPVEIKRVNLYDIQGRKWTEGNPGTQKVIRIDTRHLGQGMYFFTLESATGILYKGKAIKGK